MNVTNSVEIRENFPKQSEKALNKLINCYLTGSYVCKSIAYYYDRDDIALLGMRKLFKFCARIESRWARDLMDYQVARGGHVTLHAIREPEKTNWGTPVESLTYLLEKMKQLKDDIEKMINVAREHKDQHFKYYLKNEFLEPLIVVIRKVGVLITNANRAGSGLGEYEFSKDIKLHFPEVFDAITV
jgi:ferritin